MASHYGTYNGVKQKLPEIANYTNPDADHVREWLIQLSGLVDGILDSKGLYPLTKDSDKSIVTYYVEVKAAARARRAAVTSRQTDEKAKALEAEWNWFIDRLNSGKIQFQQDSDNSGQVGVVQFKRQSRN